MKFGPVEITLFHPEDGSHYEERVVDGKAHFVAVMGKEFKVRVSVSDINEIYPNGFLEFSLFIDGTFVTSCRRNAELLPNKSTTMFFPMPNMTLEFKGQGFTFDAVPDQPDSKIGTISLRIKSLLRKSTPPPASKKTEVKIEDSNFKVKLHKKAWQQPSVCVGIKRTVEEVACKLPLSPSPYTFFYDGKYNEKITIPYHTAEVLDQWVEALRRGDTLPAQTVPLTAAVDDAVEEVTDTVGRPKKLKVEVIDLINFKDTVRKLSLRYSRRSKPF